MQKKISKIAIREKEDIVPIKEIAEAGAEEALKKVEETEKEAGGNVEEEAVESSEMNQEVNIERISQNQNSEMVVGEAEEKLELEAESIPMSNISMAINNSKPPTEE